MAEKADIAEEAEMRHMRQLVQQTPPAEAMSCTTRQAVPATQYNFKRYEVKYVLAPAQYGELKGLLREHLVPDEYGRSTISSVYYDTPENLLLRRSVEGGPYKEKLRVRCYGAPRADSPVFIEIKKKYHGVVYKSRVSSRAAVARRMLVTGTDMGESQTDREITYLLARYPGIEPAMLVCYERCAYHTPTEDGAVLSAGSTKVDELRLTLDQNVRWCDRVDGDVWFGSKAAHQLLPQAYTLMEAKTGGALPLWFVEFLSRNAIRQRPFSKCGRAYLMRLNTLLARRRLAALPQVRPARSRYSYPVGATAGVLGALKTNGSVWSQNARVSYV